MQEILSKRIKNINWYRQGGAISLFYVYGPYHCINNSLGYDRIIYYQKGDYNAAFFDLDREREKTKWIIKMQSDDKNFINHWIAKWRIRVESMLSYIGKSFKQPVEEWDDAKLISFINKINRLWLEVWDKGVLVEWTDPEGHTLLINEVNKYNIDLSPSEIEILVSATKPTYMHEELFSRVKIIKAIKNGRNPEALIRKHADNFFWYKNNWALALNLNLNYFKNKIRKDSFNHEKLYAENSSIIKHLREIKSKRNKIIKNKKISKELANVLNMFSVIADWRDERKKMSLCMVNHYLHKILDRIANENKISLALASQLTYKEISGWKIKDKTLAEIKKRSRGAIHYHPTKNNSKWLYGKEAEAIYASLINSLKKENLSGVVANAGKAKGRAKIIETSTDFKNFKAGDVLVATMTRPEYVPLMKIASAVVTNEGGLTCHAAIVSRELKIPCIVGTQVATEVIKNGDMVDVDANKGIIKILK